MSQKSDLQKIFYDIRKKFIWTADDSHELNYDGKTITLNDHWDLMQPDVNGVLRGDCEDFSLYCSKIVKEKLGLPKSERLLTYCKTETGEGHMILCAGKYVMDNRQRRLTTISQLKHAGYSNFARPNGPVNQPWKYI